MNVTNAGTYTIQSNQNKYSVKCPIDDSSMEQVSVSSLIFIEPHFLCSICGLVLPKSIFKYENKKIETAIDYFVWISKERDDLIFRSYYKNIINNMADSFRKALITYLL